MQLKLRLFSLKTDRSQRSCRSIRYKLQALRAGRQLVQGACIAHATATLPGIAVHPNRGPAIRTLQRFKQRQGPFLLLADSIQTALRQARYISPTLRRTARASWPGSVTLIIPAKPGFHAACYKKTSMAIRVDLSASSRALARCCGGFILSSSLNRKGQAICWPDRKTHMHYRSFLQARLVEGSGLQEGVGKASQIKRVWRNNCTTMRG